MNKKQKMLTLVALVVFLALGVFHYLQVDEIFYVNDTWGLPKKWRVTKPEYAIVSDVKMPWFILGVSYAALFFLLQNKRGHGPD